MSYLDRVVASVGWQAVYESELAKGASVEDAIREAQRTVLLTQQASHIKDVPRILRESGLGRFSTIFTTDMAQTFGMLTYDLPQHVLRAAEAASRNKDGPASAARAAWKDGGGEAAKVMAGIWISGVLMHLLTKGPPDRDKKEGLVEWLSAAFGRQALESIPIAGKPLLAAWDSLVNDLRRPQNNPITAPIEKIGLGTKQLTKDDPDTMKGIWNIVEGAALVTTGLPVTGAKRFLESGAELSDGRIADAAKTLIGQQHEDRFEKLTKILNREWKEYEEQQKQGLKPKLSHRLRMARRFAYERGNIQNMEKTKKRIEASSKYTEAKKREKIAKIERDIREIKEKALTMFDEGER
jgi:hypothetical protein